MADGREDQSRAPTPPAGPPPPAVPDGTDLWPALAWIAAGVMLFTGAPELYATWKGLVFFFIGSPLMMAVTGTATFRLRAVMTAMLDEVFPRRDALTRLVRTLLRVMLAAVEATLVFSVARGAVMLMSGTPHLS